MRHLNIGKDLDSYLSKRISKIKPPKKQKKPKVETKEAENTEPQPNENGVVIIDSEPNFFGVLSKKITGLFKKS